jgi:DNA polymerase-3 subunit gamma/tau
LIRLAYAADLPDPADLIRKLKDQPSTPSGAASSAPGRTPREQAPVGRANGAALAARALPEEASGLPAEIARLEDVVRVLEDGQEPLLAQYVYQYVHLVKLAQGRIEISLEPEAPPKLAQDLGAHLTRLSGARWIVSVSAGGQPTLAQKEKSIQNAVFEKMKAAPAIAEILEIFPGAEITAVMDAE